MSTENEKEQKHLDASGKENNTLFRKTSLDRLNSPENLNEYIKVANPGMWVALVAIIVVLIGGLVWCALAELKSTCKAVVIVSDGEATCYVLDEDASSVKPGMELMINGEEYTLGSHMQSGHDFAEDPDFGDEAATYLLQGKSTSSETGDTSENPLWCFQYNVNNVDKNGKDVDPPTVDGFYEAEIVVEEISPMSLLFER